MEVPLPVSWDLPARTRRRLIERMMLRWGERGPLVELLGVVAPEPVLARLEAANHWVLVSGGVLARVLRGGRIAAADVSALGAAAQVKPPPALGQALDTAGPAGWN
jgi:hypothetical protein